MEYISKKSCSIWTVCPCFWDIQIGLFRLEGPGLAVSGPAVTMDYASKRKGSILYSRKSAAKN